MEEDLAAYPQAFSNGEKIVIKVHLSLVIQSPAAFVVFVFLLLFFLVQFALSM